jgi:hypothetical protein
MNAVPAWGTYPLNGGMWPIWGAQGRFLDILERISNIEEE